MTSLKSIPRIFLLFLAFSMVTSVQANETYPTRPIRIIVPWPAGGFTDVLARLVADRMSKIGGQPIVVENKAGANGMIGAEMVANAAADGYTLLMASADTQAINPAIHTKISYDAVRDFSSIGLIVKVPMVLVSNPQLKQQTLAELMDAAGKEPGKFRYSSWGEGSTGHLAMELLNSPRGISMMHVPYKGTTPALNDALAGHVDLTLVSLMTGGTLIETKRLHPLGITSSKRSSVAPQIPTIAEQGFPSYDVSLWYGLMAPAGTPKPIIAKLNAILNQAAHEPEFKERMKASSAEIETGSPADFDGFLKEERTRWEQAARTAKVKLD